MKVFIISLFLIGILIRIACAHKQDYSDNDFAEFEEYEDDLHNNKEKKSQEKVPNEDVRSGMMDDDDDDLKPDVKDDEEFDRQEIRDRKRSLDEDEEAMVQDEDIEEFSHFTDEEEFIGYDSEKPQGLKPTHSQEEPKITIAKVPLHLRSNWDSFYLEMLMITGLTVYFINFIFGKGKNQKLATAWFNSHKNLLESSFALVGDDGKSEIENPELRKESENVYVLWCSGRTMMEGMLIELKLIKRQDLIGVLNQLIRPTSDQLIIKIHLDEMDSFVFALGTRKSITKLSKDMADISTYCPEKKTAEKFGMGSNYLIHSEVSEVTGAVLKDAKVMAVLNKYPDLIEYFHFSDQYSGPKQQEDTQSTKLPDVKKTLVFAFNFPSQGKVTTEHVENMKPLLQLALYLADKISRLKLTKEAKVKTEKNRSKVEEAFLKATHAARAEMAQTLREEKKRKERERIMELDDPDKQRKWEEKEQKKQMKRRTPKMKTLKIKPM